MTGVVAPLVAMVPEGLVLLSSIAFAVSAVALARQHVLVNQLPAVEGLARTDILCTDKTGTLTEPKPGYGGFELLAECPVPESEALAALGAIARADASPNSTIRAIADGRPRADLRRLAPRVLGSVLLGTKVERHRLRCPGSVDPGRA